MSGLISEQILDQVRQNNDVAEVIGSYFPLKRAGANFRALCPFHKEKTPSFNVNPAKQIWHCFGCGAGGDVFKFMMMYENLDFVGAVRRLAERAGILIEFAEVEGEPSRGQKELLLKLHEQVAEFFHQTLLKEKSAEPARVYLKQRGIASETARRWRLGYSPDAWDALIRWAAAKKYPADCLETAGLILRRERGDGFYDRFRGRLMFPICDEQGRVVGFSGRILIDANDQPKYVNSPETPIFQKGRILFALDRAKRAIIEEKVALLCEGQIDTISCHEAGIANVVAPQGTALTEQHARILKRYAEEVVLIFDADEAGQNAIVRSAEPLWEASLAIRVARLPQGHDPDSFVKTFGVKEFKNLVTKAPSFFVYLLERLSKQHDPLSDRGKVQIARQMAEWLVRIPSPVLAKQYAQEVGKRLLLSGTAIEHEILKLRRKLPHLEVLAHSAEEKSLAVRSEELLLQLIFVNETVLELVTERLEQHWLTDGATGKLIRRVMALQTKGRWRGPTSLLDDTADERETRLVSEVLLRPTTSGSQENVALDCLATLERQWVESQLLQLRKRLAQGDLKNSERDKLLRQVLDLQPKLRNIPALSMEIHKPAAP
ncbi:MAG TPA: DNA primase [Verrucomicrobiae bacterium]|nr:DNA primase [Verrucomicrobiae bacterium]